MTNLSALNRRTLEMLVTSNPEILDSLLTGWPVGSQGVRWRPLGISCDNGRYSMIGVARTLPTMWTRAQLRAANKAERKKGTLSDFNRVPILPPLIAS